MSIKITLDRAVSRLRRRVTRILASPSPVSAPGKPAGLPRPQRVLVLGGSNTLMRGGYLDALLASLADRFGPAERVTNLAAGANSSVHGLMVAKAVADLGDYDLVIVEYGVNDVKLAKRDKLAIWEGAAEGLLRHLLAVRPDRPVVFLNFQRRDMKRFQFAPAVRLRRLAAHYGATTPVLMVDVDRLLRQVLFPEPADFQALYSDTAHFHRPQVAGLIGALAAGEIAGCLAQAARRGPLPKPVAPWHFANARVIDLAGDGSEGRVFSNSRFRLPTRLLRIGESLTLDLPGELVCIEYVTHRASATLRVCEDGYPPFAAHSRHARIGRFPFLLKSTPLTWKPWPELRGGSPRRLTLTALAEAESAEVVPENNMVPGDPDRMEGVFLMRLLCLG